jgi:hypothetical protein
MWFWISWLFGRVVFYLGGKTCAEVDGSYYTGLSRNTRRPCVLAPGHKSACVTDWEWNQGLNKHVRFWFAADDTGTYGRAEISEE